MVAKKCSKCGETKPISDFHVRRSRGNKPTSNCKICCAIHTKEWRAANPEKRKAQSSRSFHANKEAMRERALARYYRNKEHSKRVAAQWKALNPDKVSEQRTRWNKANPDKTREYVSKRRANKYKATPAWAEHDAIKAVYAKAVEWRMDVDHIVPLDNKIVCGLHVWANLQLLHEKENTAKLNRYWPDMPD